jgi:hypothetical protein
MPVYLSNVLQIPHHIPGKPSQYMTVNGVRNYNLCGYFAVAYCMQDEGGTTNIDTFLEYHKIKSPGLWRSLFSKNLGRTTGIYDLTMLLMGYAVTPLTLDSTPFKISAVSLALKDYQLILGVSINGVNGMLTSNGVRHWVVVEEMEVISALHAIVKVYNPFTNSHEPYKWEQIISSVGTYRQGLWVER